MPRVLLLGGTTEASRLARALAGAGIDSVFSYAGRTAEPTAQPLPTRVGGFGGVAGLAAYLVGDRVTHVIDATHPFAAGMSRNAVAACAQTHTPLLGFERPAWAPRPGDRWHTVPDIATGVAALPDAPTRIFLAIGRQHLAAFTAKPQHRYLVRLVDADAAPLLLPHTDVVVARGPFTLSGDLALLAAHQITTIVAKNSGGDGARAKLDAARARHLPVILIDRPRLPERTTVNSVEAALHWLSHCARLGV